MTRSDKPRTTSMKIRQIDDVEVHELVKHIHII